MFLNALRKAHIRLQRITFEGQALEFEIGWQDLRKVRRIRRKFRVKMELILEYGHPILQLNGRTIIGLFLLLAIPFFCQFFTWGIEVKGESIERQVEVEHLLEVITLPKRTTLLPSEHELRQMLLLRLNDVAWVHIEKNGAKLKVEVEEAPKIAEETVESGRTLFAKQGGVITHYSIESGVKQFALNEVVEKGDILVIGEIEVGDELRSVPVRGKVFVDFWRTVTFVMPRTVQFSQQQQITWKAGSLNKNEAVLQELLPWEWLPNWLNLRKISEQQPTTIVLNETDIDTMVLPLLQQKVLSSLSEDARIQSEKLLHVTFDNDTVKGQVLYLVNENVAILSSSD